MSRIGNLPVQLPAGVSATLEDGAVGMKGPRGAFDHALPEGITASLEGSTLRISRSGATMAERRMHGVTRAHIANKVKGRSTGHTITLVGNGKGFQGEVKGKVVEMQIGLSHRVLVEIPAGLAVQGQPGQNTFSLVVSGNSRELVGSFASVLYRLRPVEPYNMIGFKYSDQLVRRKAAKTTK